MSKMPLLVNRGPLKISMSRNVAFSVLCSCVNLIWGVEGIQVLNNASRFAGEWVQKIKISLMNRK